MGMMFCRGCGQQIHDTALSCPHCGAVAQGHSAAQVVSPPPPPLPEGVAGWSWGALFLNLFWAIGNKTWIGLLALIPVLGLAMPFVLAVKGREWAWRNGTWRDVEHLRSVQKKWDVAAFSTLGAIFALVIILGVIGGIQQHNRKVLAQEESQTLAQAEAQFAQSGTATPSNPPAPAVTQAPAPAPAPAPVSDPAPAPVASIPAPADLLNAYNQADLQLNQTYKAVMARLGPALRQSLRDQQRAWIKQRDAACGSMDVTDENAQRSALQCLLPITQSRTQEIQAM